MKRIIGIILSVIFTMALVLPANAISSVEVKSIRLNNSLLIIKEGDTANLVVNITPSNITQKALTYVSDNNKVAFVDEDGKINAISPGTTTITIYTYDKSKSAKCKVTVVKDKPVVISWYMVKPINTMKNQDAIEEEANKTIKEKINATLKFTLVDTASWAEKMRVISAAGEEYDLTFTSSWSNKTDENVNRHAFLPLDELIDKYGKNIKAKADSRAWKAVTYNGAIMAVPGQGQFATPVAIAFKKDLVEKYKFDYKSVKSFQDIAPYLETIKKNEPTVIPLLATAKSWPAGAVNIAETVISNGIAYNEKSGKVELVADMEDSTKNWRTTSEYYKKGYIAKDAALKMDTNAEAKTGKYAVIQSQGYTDDYSKTTAFYGYPCVETLLGYSYIKTGSMNSACTAISRTSKHPERAMMLLDLLWSDKKLVNTLAFGLEGQNYTITSGKGTDNPVIAAKTGVEQTWAIWHNWLGPLFDSWDSNWNSAASLKKMQEDNKTAPASGIVGFLFNSESVKTEIAQISAVNTENSPIMATGSMPDYDKFLTEHKAKYAAAGVEKVKAEIEKQLAEWKARKRLK